MFAVLGGKDGSQETVSINLFTFMMNQVWRAHRIVKYLRDDWLAQPGGDEYVGAVLKPAAAPQVAPSPPSPQSPVHESTVTIEEVPEGDNEAELPEGDEDNEMELAHQAYKRRRMEDARGLALSSRSAPP